MLRRLFTVCAVATTAVCVLGVASAAADTPPEFTPSPYGPIIGDVTGDGISDRVVLGQFGDYPRRTCATQVTAGLGQGLFAAPVFVTLPLRGRTTECPNLGAVLAAPQPSANRLAVGFFCCPEGPRVQVFSLVGGTATYLTGVTGVQLQPNRIGSIDFDGDGWGDLWENTDQGSGFVALLTSGQRFRPFVSLPASTVQVQFAALNHNRGTDILLATVAGVGSARAVVVDGLTGATQTLAAADRTPAGDHIDAYQLSIVDLDHDSYPDLRVDATTYASGVLTTSYWRNRSGGGRWYFTPATPPRY